MNWFKKTRIKIAKAIKHFFCWLKQIHSSFFSFIKKIIFSIVPYLSRRKWHAKLIRKTIKYSFNLFLFVVVLYYAVSFNFLLLFGTMPDIRIGKEPEMIEGSELYTSDGVLLSRYYIENRILVNYEDISKNVIDALIATEDVRFYNHNGIDIKATFSVLWYNLKGDNRGGSTITQQLAKNLYKTRKTSRGLLGNIPYLNMVVVKLKEWITAVKLERKYSKEDILTMYLNVVSFGKNIYGIHVAAHSYFNKLPSSLNLEEAAVLVGMLKAPTAYNPLFYPEKSLQRRNVVLSQLFKYNYINQLECDSLKKLAVELSYVNLNSKNSIEGSYIRNAVENELAIWCEESGYDLYTAGLKIYTTIDSRLQKYAEEAVAIQMKKLQQNFDIHWKNANPWIDSDGKEIPNYIEDFVKTTELYKQLSIKYNGNKDSINIALRKPHKVKLFSYTKGEIEKTMSSLDSIRYMKKFLNTGFLAMEPQTGEIKAWVGGIDFNYFQYDHISQMKRQPGSTFKPFVYCAAIDNGWSPCDKLIDEAVEITYEEKGEIKKWSPNNAGGKFTKEEMSLRTAMSRSCNSITVQLSEKVGFQKVADYAQKMGVKSTLQPVPSIGLGSNEVSLLELVAAYGVFINQGVYCEPLLVSKITDRDGHVIKVFTSKSKKVLSDSTANKMVYMLKGGIDEVGGTSRSLLNYNRIVSGNDLGGKTGTTSNYSDGWFIGVTNKLIAGCWVGGDDRCIHFRESAKMEGAKTALPVFGIFLTKVYSDSKTKKYKSYFSNDIKEISEKYDCEKQDSINNKLKNKVRTFFKNIFKKNKNKKEPKTYSGKPKNK